MRTFPVDDDVLALVWERANPQPFEQLSFNDALKRVLQSDPPVRLSAVPISPLATPPKLSRKPISADELLAELEHYNAKDKKARTRAPKANLLELVRLGMLREGQELVFMDYRGQRRSEFKATISGPDLEFKGERYSMSALAEQLFKLEGHIGESVRGPAHWVTSDNKSVRELWEAALHRRTKNDG